MIVSVIHERHNGHYHPTEMVSDKISSLLLFHPKLALHVTRPVRWDSDHVIRFDDETREIAKEIVASGRMDDIVKAAQDRDYQYQLFEEFGL